MKKIKLLLPALLLLVLCACSKEKNKGNKGEVKTNTIATKIVDGVKIISNKSQPQFPDMKLKLNKLSSFKNEGTNAESMASISSAGIDFDSQNNLYVLDNQKSKIHKFSPKGEHLLSFGGQGEGPGEFKITGSTIIINDTVIVPFWFQKKFVLFNTNGEYLKDIKFADDNKILSYPIKYDDYLLNVSINSFTADGETMTQTQSILLFKQDLSYLKTIYEKVKEKKVGTIDLNEDDAPAAAMDKDNNIYIAEKNPNYYKITVTNLEGKPLQVIRRNYRQIAYTKENLEKIKESYQEWGITKVIGAAKNSIRNIFIDKKYNYLWVETAENSDPKLKIYDLFENGILIAKVNIPIKEKSVVVFRAGKIVIGNVTEGTIEVFDYSLVK